MNRLKQIIEGMERIHFPFKPQSSLYKTLGIGRKRFWQIMRNETQPTFDEAERIAEYFGVNAKDLLTSNQKAK